MSKAILVMDIPKSCYQCPCFSITKCRAYKCGTTVEDDRKKPDWCPLRELPDKKEISHFCETSTDWQKGYNTCLDDILK